MKKLRVDRTVRSDVVVIGSGVAGLTAALSLSPLSLTLLTKGRLGRASSSWLAQGGIAVAWDSADSPALHAQDTVAVGGGLSDQSAVDLITRNGPDRIAHLLELGTRFDADEDGRLRLGREAAHSRRRIVHANGDATGAAVVDSLVDAARELPSMSLYENWSVLDLLVDGSRVLGVLAVGAEGNLTAFLGAATILATGGVGGVYSWTTNPLESTGDGLAIAARAGARLADLEFMQFHPTALDAGSNPLPLLTEALRGEGSVLVDSRGRRFMVDQHPLAELGPRDVVARAIWDQLQNGEKVYLDASVAIGSSFPERFPTVFDFCLRQGLDPRRERIPVTPAAHYHIGGVESDCSGRTSLEGLWVCGEVAATGVHGANRLASNSLLEALVFGKRVAEDVKSAWKPRKIRAPFASGLELGVNGGREDLKGRIRRLMWEHVGLIRDEAGLRKVLSEFNALESDRSIGLGEVRNMVTVGRLIATAALMRQESRGVHFRADFPDVQESWGHRLVFTDPLSHTGEGVLARAH
jgi:L-aspartate oxidase